MRRLSAAGPEPFGGNLPHLVDAFEDIVVQPFVPDCPIMALDIGVLPGLAGLNVGEGMPLFSAHSMSVPLTYAGRCRDAISTGSISSFRSGACGSQRKTLDRSDATDIGLSHG